MGALGIRSCFGNKMLPFVGTQRSFPLFFPQLISALSNGLLKKNETKRTHALQIIGYPGSSVAMFYELEQASLPSANITAAFPMSTMVYFQFVFAAITIGLIAGSFLCRMNIYAWVFFVPLWITFSYVVGAFSLWGGGFLFQMGVIDYSGG
jgi:ammonia channel protein AmtB